VCYSQKEITPSKSKNYVGEHVIVTGKIVEVSESSIGNVFLYFDRKHPNNLLSIVVFASDREQVQGDLRINWYDFVDATISVSGIIGTYNYKHEIILRKAEQIVSID
jgi:hypothetical protein